MKDRICRSMSCMYSINKHCILTPTASQNTYLGEQRSPKTPRKGIEKLVAAMYNKDKLEFEDHKGNENNNENA